MREPEQRQRFLDQLPYLVNGTLPEHEATWMREQIEQHDDARAEWELVRSMQAHAQVVADPLADDQRWQMLSHLIEKEPQPRFWQKLRGWQLPAVPALGSFALVLIGLLWVLPEHESNAVRSLVVERQAVLPCPQPWRAKVTFIPEVTHQELVIQIRAAGVKDLSVPTESGEWWLRWAHEAERDQGMALLRAAGIVDTALVTPADSTAGCRQ